MARGPVVGIVGGRYQVPRFWGELPIYGTARSYVDRVVAAGGRPVLLPIDSAADLLDTVHALVLTGGDDIDPSLYGGPPPGPMPAGGPPDQARDLAEIELVRAAAGAGVPTLGVCRGMQVMVVAFGGTLVRDLGMAHVLPAGLHPVRTAPGSLVAALVGGSGTPPRCTTKR